jgi:putative ABC transport system permease protein
MIRWFYIVPLWLRSLFRRRRVEQELSDELRFHLEELIEEKRATGTPPEEARRAALRELGGVELIKADCRDARRVDLIESLLQDVRYGWRQLGCNPGMTAVVVLTLALGIGANTAVYSLVDTILLRPYPYRDPERLVVVSETLSSMGGDSEIGVAGAEYLDYRDRSRSFVETAAYERAGFNLTGDQTPLRVNAAAVTASVFSLLGVPPLLGRAFTAADEQRGSPPVAVLSYSLWRNHYGADAGILGKGVKLDERPYRVIGVMPPSFQFPADGAPLSERVDLWVPEIFSPDRVQDRLREFGVGFVGRLKPGVSAPQAQKDVWNVAAAFMREYQYGTVRVVPRVHSFAAYTVEKARPLLVLLMAAVAGVLLIACANVANLLLARGSRRGHEMALRSALGAARRRLFAQCLVESLLLSLLGAGAGLALAFLIVDGVRTFGPADVPRLAEVAVDPSALLFTVILSLLTTLLFGLAPAWQLARALPEDCLKESARAGKGRTTQRLQASIAVAEMAIALVLLVAGSLVLQSFVRVLNIPLGFRPQGLFVVRTLFDGARYPDPIRRAAAQEELIEAAAHLPGVEVAAAASHLPLSDSRQIAFRLQHAAPDDFHWAQNSLVSPGYFPAMGIPILRGRDFSAEDRSDRPLAAIVSETLARRYFPGQDPLGRQFHWAGALFTIVGVAGDVHISALDADPPPMIYLSLLQLQAHPDGRTALLLRVGRARQDGHGLLAELRQRIWSLDRDLPVYDFTAFDSLISASMAQRRFTTALMLSFAAAALALAVIGLFGVMSYLVAQRERELAIRMALGADRKAVYRAVMLRGATLALAGGGAGLALFPLVRRLVTAALYQTRPYDPITLVIVSALLTGVALLASYVPARRATRIDPMVALRHE